ncbi:MAG TPA: hypothetical protein VF980_13610 [Thermoanaerobaculia bacterium]
MGREKDYFAKRDKNPTMRPLLLKDLPETVQIAIKKRAWRDDVSYEKAAADLLHDAEIERIAQHDVAIWEREHRFDDEPF